MISGTRQPRRSTSTAAAEGEVLGQADAHLLHEAALAGDGDAGLDHARIGGDERLLDLARRQACGPASDVGSVDRLEGAAERGEIGRPD